MQKKCQSFKDTLREVASYRPKINPNPSFKRLLQVWYDCSFNLYSDQALKTWKPIYLRFRNCFARKRSGRTSKRC